MPNVNKAFGDLITFTRASAGTSFRPVSYGPEIIGDVGFDSDPYWSKGAGWSVSGSAATRTNTGAVSNLSKGGLTPSPLMKIYKIEISLTVTSGAAAVLIGGYNGPSFPVSGSFVRYMQVTHASSDTNVYVQGDATFAGSITSLSVKEATFDRAGDPIQLVDAPSNIPRFDYDQTTGFCKGLLIEEQRANYFKNSEMLGYVVGTPGVVPNSWAIVNGAGLSTQVVGGGLIDGIQYLDFRIFGTTNAGGGFSVGQIGYTLQSASAGQTWCSKIRLSMVGGSMANIGTFTSYVQFADSAQTTIGTFGTSKVLSATPVDVVAQGMAPTNTAYVRSFVNITATSGVNIDITIRMSMPQLEAGTFPTSYIKTYGTGATRAADIAKINNAASWYGQSEGSIIVEASSLAAVPSGGFSYMMALSDGTSANTISLLRNSANHKLEIYKAGVAQAGDTNGLNTADGVVSKHKISFKANSVMACVNGGSVSLDTVADMPSNLTMLVIGSSPAGNGTYSMNGYIRKISYSLRTSTSEELAYETLPTDNPSSPSLSLNFATNTAVIWEN